jgi:hypothetical protein
MQPPEELRGPSLSFTNAWLTQNVLVRQKLKTDDYFLVKQFARKIFFEKSFGLDVKGQAPGKEPVNH